MSTTVEVELKAIQVGMGELKIGQHPEQLAAVLGSCIGVAVTHPRHNVGLMAHVMLPTASGRDGPLGKFADTAVAGMLSLLREHGYATRGLTAKIAGGSNMFGSAGPMQIGQANVEAVHVELKKHGIPIMGEDVGGSAGRRVRLNCETGILTISRIGAGDLTL